MKAPKLISDNQIPYGGFFQLNIPERGLVGRGQTFDAIAVAIRKYRRANNIPVGIGLDDEIESALCERYPDECIESDATVPKSRRLRLADVLTGTRVMVAHKLAGSPLVSQDEANRRAQICVGCPFNQDFAKLCSGICPELKTLVAAIIGSSQTPYDGRLKSCSICGCFLDAAVWVPLEIQWKPLPDAMKAQFKNVGHCWKKM